MTTKSRENIHGALRTASAECATEARRQADRLASLGLETGSEMKSSIAPVGRRNSSSSLLQGPLGELV